MGVAGSYQYPTMKSVVYGKPAAEALREGAERLGAKRVYLIASRTPNTQDASHSAQSQRADVFLKHVKLFLQ